MKGVFSVAIILIISMQLKGQSNYFPDAIDSKIYLGMTLTEFKAVSDMQRLKKDRIQTSRIAFFQPSADPNINAIIYYFDKDLRGNPLYEVIIRYEERKMAKKNARSLFGAPNFTKRQDGKLNEWRMTPENGPAIWAWTHKTTLVIVGKVPETEWSKEWNEN